MFDKRTITRKRFIEAVGYGIAQAALPESAARALRSHAASAPRTVTGVFNASNAPTCQCPAEACRLNITSRAVMTFVNRFDERMAEFDTKDGVTIRVID